MCLNCRELPFNLELRISQGKRYQQAQLCDILLLHPRVPTQVTTRVKKLKIQLHPMKWQRKQGEDILVADNQPRAANIKGKKLRYVSSHMAGCRPWEPQRFWVVLAYRCLEWSGNVEMIPYTSPDFINTQEENLHCSWEDKSTLASSMPILKRWE